MASKAEAEAGAVNDKLMTPQRTAEAIAELSPPPVIAEKAEAEAGSINDKFMTPLRTAEAISSQTSALLTAGEYFKSSDIATTGEAEGGTDDTKLMTPLKTAQAIAKLSSAVTVSATAPTTPKEGDLW